MKKYILRLILALYPCSTIVAMDKKVDLHKIVLAQKAKQSSYEKHLEQLSFTAFHPHELNSSLAAQKDDESEQIEPSLYGRFGELDVTYMISEYLSPKVPPALSCSGVVFTDDTEAEIESIKDFLRTQYWLQSMRQAQNLPAQKYNEWKFPLVDYDRALSLASENKYRKHNLEIASLALACGAGINRVRNCSVPLENAAKNNMYSLSKFLIKQGAKISFNDSHHVIALSHAIRNDNVLMTKLFIAADIANIYDSYMLMHAAARHNAPKVIQYLHDSGCDLNAKDRPTPLHIAAYSQNYKAIETLISLDADQTLKDKTYQDTLNKD